MWWKIGLFLAGVMADSALDAASQREYGVMGFCVVAAVIGVGICGTPLKEK